MVAVAVRAAVPVSNMDFNWKFGRETLRTASARGLRYGLQLEVRYGCPSEPPQRRKQVSVPLGAPAPCMALYGPLRAIKTGVFARGSHFVSPQEKQLSVRDSIPDWYRHKEIL